MISYYMQVAITIASGPILTIFDLMAEHRNASYGTRSLLAGLKQVHVTVTSTNTFFAFTLIAASVARWKQGAFLFEIMFMKKINQLQIAVVILSHAYWLFQQVALPYGLSQRVDPELKPLPSAFILPFISLVLYFVFFCNVGLVPYATLNIYHKIIAGCVQKWGYQQLGLDATKPAQQQKQESPLKSFLEGLEAIGYVLAGVLVNVLVMLAITILNAVCDWIKERTAATIRRIRSSETPRDMLLHWLGLAALCMLQLMVHPFAMMHQFLRNTWVSPWLPIPERLEIMISNDKAWTNHSTAKAQQNYIHFHLWPTAPPTCGHSLHFLQPVATNISKVHGDS